MRWETHRASSFGRRCVAGWPVELSVLCQEASCLLQERRHIQLVPLHHFLTWCEHGLNRTDHQKQEIIKYLIIRKERERRTHQFGSTLQIYSLLWHNSQLCRFSIALIPFPDMNTVIQATWRLLTFKLFFITLLMSYKMMHADIIFLCIYNKNCFCKPLRVRAVL